jgi:hypothetical protein
VNFSSSEHGLVYNSLSYAFGGYGPPQVGMYGDAGTLMPLMGCWRGRAQWWVEIVWTTRRAEWAGLQGDPAEPIDMVPAFTDVSRLWWGDADWGWSGNRRQEKPWGGHVRCWNVQQDAAIQAVSIAAEVPIVSCPKQKRSGRIVRARWISTRCAKLTSERTFGGGLGKRRSHVGPWHSGQQPCAGLR